MLEYLRIKNFALLENVEMEFSKGLNIITGESGAGKSFIIKAILFLLAHKTASSAVRSGADIASVEAVFSKEVVGTETAPELILRRELSASSGRSRFFINDVLSSQESIKDIREDLILYTSQHAQHKLLQPAFHTTLLDTFLGNNELLIKRDALLQELRIGRRKQEELEQKYASLAERRELLEFQQKEIMRVNPSVEEEELLEAQQEEYKNAKVTIDAIREAMKILDGDDAPAIQDILRSLQKIVQRIAQAREEFLEQVHIIENSIELLDKVHSKLQEPLGTLPPDNIDTIEERLFEFSKLKRSLHRSIAEICDFEREIEENLSFLDSCELEMKYLKKEEEKRIAKLQEIVQSITTARHNGASILSKTIEQALLPLGFTSGCRVIFSFTPQEIWNSCFEDKARIRFCPNIGHQDMPLDSIASGGELSRFLLAISSIIASTSSQTLIFDEVDTGIGGVTLQKVAEQLVHLAKERQLIVITHWGNVAKHAERHFYIEKIVEGAMATTHVRNLSQEERKEELRRMNGE